MGDGEGGSDRCERETRGVGWVRDGDGVGVGSGGGCCSDWGRVETNKGQRETGQSQWEHFLAGVGTGEWVEFEMLKC